MTRVALVLCILISSEYALSNELSKVLPVISPTKILHSNLCLEDLGCFYTGPPFYHAVNRPISLPPTSTPHVNFHLFTVHNPKVPYNLLNTEESLKNSFFNAKKDTKIYIPGFNVELDFNSTRFKIKDAILKEKGYDVIVVDWSADNGFPYAQAVANARVVGAIVAKLIHFLMAATGLTPKSFHIIGHSLGAHIAGYAGERVKNLGRITGLDPAGPFFQEVDAEVRLDKTDAKFVDVIHTNGADLSIKGKGLFQAIGHQDFYPNGGSEQHGCEEEFSVNGIVEKIGTQLNETSCNHARSRELFLESIENKDCIFLGAQCNSYDDFKKGNCPPQSTTVAEMGFYSSPFPSLEPTSKLFLRTNANSPFCDKDGFFV